MKLQYLLKDVKCIEVYGSTEIEVKNITINSKEVEDGSLFVAIEGFKHDGHTFIGEAISAGSTAVVVQRRLDMPPGVTQILVDDTRKALPLLCKNFYGNPSASFKLVGVTGTNGKTTTSYLIDSILKTAGMKTSLVTTVESFLDGKKVSFERTTPESLDLNIFFNKSRERKVNAVCMEVSSHSIDLHRIDYLDFNCFVFTNLSQDHLDYHKDMKNYFNTKKKLFLKNNRDIYSGEKAVINMDDSYGKEILEITDLKKISYSIKSKDADIWASDINNSISGIEMTVNTGDGKKMDVLSPLCGYFNVYNILAATGVCLDMGIKTEYIIEGISSMHGVKGRFEKVYDDGKTTVIVDYAHTPDGLENVLRTGRELLKPGGRLISVFGCGGDRDKGKRKIMGYISGRYSDYTIITSDNPRSEEPLSIINMIKEGVINSENDRFIVEVDRREAIFKALKMAGTNDLVIIAGKGHESYQEFKDYKIPFSDQEIVSKWASQRK